MGWTSGEGWADLETDLEVLNNRRSLGINKLSLGECVIERREEGVRTKEAGVADAAKSSITFVLVSKLSR